MAAATGRPAKVVVGIPTYNRAAGLHAAVQSALSQDYPNVEVIISDNASTDGTREYSEALCASEPRVRYMRHERNQGATQNFRAALAAADGEYFMWLADDDWIAPGYIQNCVERLCSDPGCLLVGGRARYQSGALTWDGEVIDCGGDSPVGRVLSYYRQVELNGIFYGVMRTSAARAVFLHNWIGGDWLFVAALAYQGRLRTDPDAVIHRDGGGTSQSRRRMAASLGVPGWQAAVPVTVALVVNTAVEALHAPVLGRGPWWHRLALAVLIPGWILAFKPAQVIARRLKGR